MNAKRQKTKLILIGYRATGKSTLAPLVARRWNFDWFDSDRVIEERAGKRISAIFRDDGERAFRDLEARVIADLLDEPRPLVIATGGGAPMREETRRLMRDRGVVLWLRASVETIAERMLGDASTPSSRPTLTDAKSPIEEIERVLTARVPVYRATSDLAIDVDGKTVDELVEEIVDATPELFI